jgi:hypothetical protein
MKVVSARPSCGRIRLGVTLRFVIDAARPDRVHMPPIRLGLDVVLGIAVDLARRGEQEARALELCHPEHVVRSVGADLERVQREPRVVDGARRACEVENEVDGLLEEEGLCEIVVEGLELRLVRDVLDVLERAGVEVVDADDTVPLGEQVIAEVGADEAGAAGDE